MNKYTREYFIKKFEALSDEDVAQGDSTESCALFHCGTKMVKGNYKLTDEGKALGKLLDSDAKDNGDLASAIWQVNDGHCGNKDLSPRNRVLAALRS